MRQNAALKRVRQIAAVLVAAALAGCYHYTFEERPANGPTITYRERRPTWFNGFVGNGRVDTSKYCAHPVKTELRVTASDVALGVGTLLIYTPHTLFVTCERPRL